MICGRSCDRHGGGFRSPGPFLFPPQILAGRRRAGASPVVCAARRRRGVSVAPRPHQTSAVERHPQTRRISGRLGGQYRLRLIDCRCAGTTGDLRSLTGIFPGLIAEAHGFCQEVGAAGVAAGRDGFLAASVRRAGGTNVPVISRTSLSDPRQVADVLRRVNAVAGTATVQFL